MSCPDAGALRALRDDERPDLAGHAATCPACRERSRAQAEDARLAATVLGGPGPDVGVDAALARARSAAPSPPVALRPRTARPRLALGRAAAALVALAVLGGVLATPGGRAAADSLLERFRSEQLVVVPVDVAAIDPAALEPLLEVADLEGLESLVAPEEVADLAEAAAVSGIAATPLDPATLPPGASGPVTVLAQAPQTLRIDFADGAELPSALRRAVLVLAVPGAVLQVVEGRDAPAVVRGEAGLLGVSVEGGPSLGEVRDALLSLPGLPPETVATLRGIEDWETTLPLPLPVGTVAWEPTTIDGRPALAFGDESGLGSALLWRADEGFVGVGGTLPLSQVRRLAEGG